MHMLKIWLALFVMLGATLGGCAGAPPVGEASTNRPVYRLGAGDRIRIVVFGEDALSKDYALTSAGDVAFPLIGDVKAAGLTPAELGAALTQRLGNGYLSDPRVSVEVLNYRPFYILGEVQKSGEFPYVTDLSALQAIALAGGYTYRADRRRLFIRHAGETAERTYELRDDNPVWILPGDTIRVGERYF
jgi:protein involved in polysaccharide export with SLBB domain